MKKSLIYSIPLFLIILFYLFACNKDKIKKGCHGVLIGKYICKVQIYNQTVFTHCQDDEKVSEMSIVEEVYFVNDHQLAIKPSISLSYNIEDLSCDTVNYVRKVVWGVNDTSLGYNNANPTRFCSLVLNNDSLYSIVDEPCNYSYYITGKKIK